MIIIELLLERILIIHRKQKHRVDNISDINDKLSKLIQIFLFSFICLHYRGSLYEGDSKNQKLIRKTKCLPNCYYAKGRDKWKSSASLGVADFLIYNMLVLVVLPLSSSTIVKTYVTVGTIVSVQIGYFLTSWLGSFIKILGQPAVPLPVIIVTMYLFILDIIFSYNSDQCI